MECFACSDTAVKWCPNGHGLCDECIDDGKWGIPSRINCCPQGPTFDIYFAWFTKSKRKKLLRTLIAPKPEIPVAALVKEAFEKTLIHHCPRCNAPFGGFDGCCVLTHEDCCTFCGVCDEVFPHYTDTCDQCSTPVEVLEDISRCPTCDVVRYSSNAEASKAAHLHFEIMHSEDVYDTSIYHKARGESTKKQIKALANDLALPNLIQFLPPLLQADVLIEHLDENYESRLIKQTIVVRAQKKKKTVCRFWARGVCRNLRCRFAHGEHEL